MLVTIYCICAYVYIYKYRKSGLVLYIHIYPAIAEELTKLQGVKGVHFRHWQGLEKDIEKLFLNFVVGSEKHKVNLTGLKMSYLSSIEKIQQQNEKILKSLKSEDFEEELFENLKQEVFPHHPT